MIKLTDRERTVATMIASGSTAKDIATALGLGIKTVDAHRYSLYRKARVNSAVGLCLWAIRKGIIVAPKPECEEVETANALLSSIDTAIADLNRKRAELARAAAL